MASASHRKEALLITNLSGSSTGLTTLRLCPARRSRSFTSLTTFQAGNAQLSCHSVRSLFETYFKIIAKVGASLRGSSSRPRSCAAEDITEAKQVSENVFNASEARCAPVSGTRTARHSCVSKSIVTAALFSVLQNAVSFCRFFEFVFGTRVVWIFVWVKLYRQTTIGTLDLLVVRCPANSQYFVIIAFTHSNSK